MMNSSPIDESTSGVAEARKALADSRRASRRTDTLIADAQMTFARVRETRESNHFADKFRAIIRGAA